jgi:hypothetical protein
MQRYGAAGIYLDSMIYSSSENPDEIFTAYK